MVALTQRIAWRYIKTRKREGFISLTTWFAIVGIALGVGTLILVTSLMNGVRTEMRARFLGVDGHISIVSQRAAFTTYHDMVEYLEGIPEVATATAKISGQVMATRHGHARGAQVIAMPSASIAKRPILNDHIISGKERLDEGLVIGHRMAASLGVREGDYLTLMAPEGSATPFGFVPRMKSYPVVGFLDMGMHLYDTSLILMPFADAQRFFKLNTAEGDAVSEVEALLLNADDSEAVAARIAATLPDTMQVQSWESRNQTVFAALAIQRNVMVMILTLIVLVAVFNIISTQMMLVQQKAHDIAILRTMGASRAFIQRIFLLNGAMIGLAGTLSGLVLGLLLADNLDAVREGLESMLGIRILPENIYFLSTLPTKTDATEVMIISLFAVGLALVASLYPASRAARISPAEILRDG